MDDGTDALEEPAEAERVAGERERVDVAVDDDRGYAAGGLLEDTRDVLGRGDLRRRSWDCCSAVAAERARSPRSRHENERSSGTAAYWCHRERGVEKQVTAILGKLHLPR
jgi:hypothetical protein